MILGIKNDSLTSFIEHLSEEILKIEPSSMLHPNIIGAYEHKKKNALKQTGLDVKAEYKEDVKPNYARQTITTVEGKVFLENTLLHQEVFGPFSMVVQCENTKELEAIILKLEGQLTGTLIAEESEMPDYLNVVEALQSRVGRVIFNGVPTGVEVCPAMNHGGPYPASTDSRFTAVGIHSIKRWVRPFSYQDWPNSLLPDELKDENPTDISRLINNIQTSDKI